MMRTPRRRKHAGSADPAVELPACRNYASLSDTVLRRRSGRLTTALVGTCAAALVVTAGIALHEHTPARHVAAAPERIAPAATAAAPAAHTGSPIDRMSGTAKPPVTTPRRAKFQVAGVRVVARRDPSGTGVQRISISPAVSPAHAASVEKAVLGNLITGLDSTPALTSVWFRHRPATVEHYLSRAGVSMSALCVQWTEHTAYLLTAPSGAAFARLQKEFRPT